MLGNKIVLTLAQRCSGKTDHHGGGFAHGVGGGVGSPSDGDGVGGDAAQML